MSGTGTNGSRGLLRAYHEGGDRGARERLIEEHLPLVRALASRYAGRGERFEDLVQVGAVGLIKAVDRFDLERQVELGAYATPLIVGEIKAHFRDRTWSVHVPRRLKELRLLLIRVRDDLTSELGRSPTIAELAGAARVDEEEAAEALATSEACTTRSLSEPPGDGERAEPEPLGTLGSEEPAFGVVEDLSLLASAFGALDERERRIVHCRFFRGLTQSEIARELGMSQMHVSRLIRRALEKMRLEIGAGPAELDYSEER